jgi:hypothetical protein
MNIHLFTAQKVPLADEYITGKYQLRRVRPLHRTPTKPLHSLLIATHRGLISSSLSHPSFSLTIVDYHTTMSLSNKLPITDVDLKDKRVLIRVRTPFSITNLQLLIGTG